MAATGARPTSGGTRPIEDVQGLGEAFVGALAARDFDRLTSCFEPRRPL